MTVEVRRGEIGIFVEIAAIAPDAIVACLHVEPGQRPWRPVELSAQVERAQAVIVTTSRDVADDAAIRAAFGRQTNAQLVADQRTACRGREGAIVAVRPQDASIRTVIGHGRIAGRQHDGTGQRVQALDSGLRPAQDFDLIDIPEIRRSPNSAWRGMGAPSTYTVAVSASPPAPTPLLLIPRMVKPAEP